MHLTENQPHTERLTKDLQVTNKMGIHARPAAMIVQITNRYSDTDVLITKEDETANGKSIMGIMMLAAGYKTKLQIKASGKGAKELLEELEDLFKRKFEEI
jgi:phosphocarrier protein HPr